MPAGFFFQAEDGIRDFCLSRGLGDVYKRQDVTEYNRHAALAGSILLSLLTGLGQLHLHSQPNYGWSLYLTPTECTVFGVTTGKNRALICKSREMKNHRRNDVVNLHVVISLRRV